MSIVVINRLRKRIRDRAFWRGEIFVRELPLEWSEQDFVQQWAKMTRRERDRHTLYHTHNLLTAAGRTQLLNYIGATGAVTPFCQYFAVGNGPIQIVQPLDTTINGELFRGVPSLVTPSGNTTDISLFLGASQGNGILTNCGLFGNNATGTANSGTLMTHALFTFNKQNGQQVTCDYLVTLN